MTKHPEMLDRVFDLVASGVTDGRRIFAILRAESWPWVETHDPVDFYDWLTGQGFTIVEDAHNPGIVTVTV